MDLKKIPVSDHSVYDLEHIFELNKSKVIVFPSDKLLSSFEEKIAKKKHQRFTEKTSIVGSKNSVVNNLICTENSVKGVDLCTDLWVFYGFPMSRAQNLLRTNGENIIYTI